MDAAGPRFDRPLVVTIGAMKAGTSSLHAWMALHPELAMSFKKELNYFTHATPPLGGIHRYKLSFPLTGRICGESSVNYAKHPLFAGVPERMAAEVPRARLVYVLRDPIARILSHYRHNLSHGRETRSMHEALRPGADNKYVATSRYHDQLTRFLKHYDRSQVLLVDFAELRDTPLVTLRRVFEFVGVDPDVQHEGMGRVHHDSSKKGQPNALGRPIATIPGVRHLRYALPQVFEKPLPKPELPDDLRASLQDALRADVEALRVESGLALDWGF